LPTLSWNISLNRGSGCFDVAERRPIWVLRPWTADYYAHSSILAQLVSGAIAIAASLPPRPTDAGELTIEREEEKKSSVRPCNPPVPEWSCYFSELAQIPEWVRNGLVTFPSWHKSQNGLVTFPRWHKSQNGLVTFPRWHKSRNGRVTQTFLVQVRTGWQGQ